MPKKTDEKRIGITPCPQSGCGKAAVVYEGSLDADGKRAFLSECPNDHRHTFGDYYLPNVQEG